MIDELIAKVSLVELIKSCNNLVSKKGDCNAIDCDDCVLDSHGFDCQDVVRDILGLDCDDWLHDNEYFNFAKITLEKIDTPFHHFLSEVVNDKTY